ncbi:MAG: hypothetical protein C0524_11370 [Rhodobacter sp.]|nr:hypothetical protein [Rhodobacter sp.]
MFIKAFAVALTFASAAAGQTLPEPLGDGLSDFANVLDATEEGRITRLLEATRAETGVQMVVVTLPTIEANGGAGMRLDAYAKALFNAWGVGEADRNDGILMLVATEAREVRIALGGGYDAVYDGRAARVLSTAVLPEFREGRIAGGIEAGIVSSRERLITPFLEGRPVTVTDGFADETPSSLPWVAGIGGLAGLIGYGFWSRARARRTCPSCGAQTLNRTKEVIDPPTRSSSGTGLQHLTCQACGFVDRRSFSIPALRSDGSDGPGGSRGGSSGSGRSSGGFGGGRSSGGGASGKW